MQVSCVFDILVDLSAVDYDSEAAGLINTLASEEGLFADGRRVTIVIPAKATVPADAFAPALLYRNGAIALAAAVAAAGVAGRPLAIVIGASRWRNQTLAALAAEADCDPMIATVQPRFGRDEFGSFDALFDGAPSLPPAATAFLPRHHLTPERLSALQVLSSQAAAAAPRITAGSLDEAYAQLLRGLRRRGYRNLVCNRITANISGAAYVPLPQEDGRTPADDHRQLADLWSRTPARQLETLLAQAFTAEGHPRILFDCRGLSPHVNGTSVSTLGLLNGLREVGLRGLEPILLANSETAEFHRLEANFPEFEVQRDEPKGGFLAAVLLNQPWSVDAIRGLHRVAGLIAFNILDTIAWDIVFAAPPDVERAWRVAGQTADILFFNSAYSRDRYRFRFDPDERIDCVVTHHSLAPGELVAKPGGRSQVDGPFVLVVGNAYPHKEVAGTLETLGRAFPYDHFVSIGSGGPSAPNVTSFTSGNLPDSLIGRLYAEAQAVVFPSHYEGFGLPVAEALANGKPVIVRSNPLWSEIAGLTSRPELLVTFRTEADLVAAVERALAGRSPEGAERARSSVEPGWADCASRVRDALERAISRFDCRRWLARDALLPL